MRIRERMPAGEKSQPLSPNLGSSISSLLLYAISSSKSLDPGHPQGERFTQGHKYPDVMWIYFGRLCTITFPVKTY